MFLFNVPIPILVKRLFIDLQSTIQLFLLLFWDANLCVMLNEPECWNRFSPLMTQFWCSVDMLMLVNACTSKKDPICPINIPSFVVFSSNSSCVCVCLSVCMCMCLQLSYVSIFLQHRFGLLKYVFLLLTICWATWQVLI